MDMMFLGIWGLVYLIFGFGISFGTYTYDEDYYNVPCDFSKYIALTIFWIILVPIILIGKLVRKLLEYI